jgi:hypothetical protein
VIYHVVMLMGGCWGEGDRFVSVLGRRVGWKQSSGELRKRLGGEDQTSGRFELP